MSEFNKFMKQNKIVKENVMYPATESLLDENGEALLWEIRPLTIKELEQMRIDCTKKVPVGKGNEYRVEEDEIKLITKVMCKSIVSPNLNNKELQDSYGVMSAEELLKEIIDSPADYDKLLGFIDRLNGLSGNPEDEVTKVKN